MNILSIETSGTTCGVAVSERRDTTFSLRSVIEILIPHAHDTALARITQQALHVAGLTIADVDVVAVSSGPGSFTGLRIGAAFAKGLCFNTPTKLLGVSTMTSLAHATAEVATVAGRSTIMTVIASHRDLLYVQRFTVDASPLDDVSVCEIRAARDMVTADMVVVGPGAHLVTDSPISGLARCSPRFVALAASRMLRSGNVAFEDPMTFEPTYQQDFHPKS